MDGEDDSDGMTPAAAEAEDEEHPPAEEGPEAEDDEKHEEMEAEAAMGGGGADAAAEMPGGGESAAESPDLDKQYSLKWSKKERSYSVQLKICKKPERFQQQLSFLGGLVAASIKMPSMRSGRGPSPSLRLVRAKML